jgi:hypothetical protein
MKMGCSWQRFGFPALSAVFARFSALFGPFLGVQNFAEPESGTE